MRPLTSLIVYEYIRNSGPVSRPEILKATGISYPALSSNINTLRNMGAITGGKTLVAASNWHLKHLKVKE